MHDGVPENSRWVVVRVVRVGAICGDRKYGSGEYCCANKQIAQCCEVK